MTFSIRQSKLFAALATSIIVAIGVLLANTQVNAQQKQDIQEKPVQTKPTDEMAISEILSLVDVFEVFNSLSQRSGLSQVLSGPGPFTVFVPTDGSFGKLPQETIAIFQSENPKSIEVLAYHVIDGNMDSKSLLEAELTTTAQGNPVLAAEEEGELKINNATVIIRDLEANNGTIHVVDSVLFP